MKGLLKKDLLVLTKQLLIFLILIPILSVSGDVMTVVAVLLGAVLPMTAVAYDDQSKWNELAEMLPYTKTELVFSKYLLGYVGMLGADALVFAGRVVLFALGKETLDHIGIGLWGGMVSGLLFLAINNPILFKFGAEKGRYVYLAVIFFVGACGSFFSVGTSGPAVPKVAWFIPQNNPYLLGVLLLGLVIILNIVSVQISIRVKTKE